MGIHDILKRTRDEILATGLKPPAQKKYTEDGHEQYRKWATALENSIELLEDGAATLPEVVESLKTLHQESDKYFDSHFGLFGIPIHKYGRTRLLESGKLYSELPSLTVMLSNCQNKIDEVYNKEGWGEKSISEMREYKEELSFKTAGLKTVKLNGRSFAQERLIPNMQMMAYDRLYNMNKEVCKCFRPGQIDNCLEVVRKWSDTVSVPARAEVFSVAYPMSKLLRHGITAKELSEELDNFNGNNCDTYERKLANYDLFQEVQRLCFERNPDVGLSAWAYIEDVADKLTEEYLVKSQRPASLMHDAESIVSAYQVDYENEEDEFGTEGTKKTHEQKLESAYERAAAIMVDRALADPKGRRVLHMMAIERSDNKATQLKDSAIRYLRRKNPFCNKKGEFDIGKVNAFLNKDSHIAILKDFYNHEPQITLRLEGNFKYYERQKVDEVYNPRLKTKGVKPEAAEKEKKGENEMKQEGKKSKGNMEARGSAFF